jgi:hypothetical protein
MKQITLISLLIIFLTFIVGYQIEFCCFKIIPQITNSQFRTKQNIKLVKVSFNKSIEPNWTIKSREFKYQNELFDVVNVSKKGTLITYYCICDKHDSSILNSLSSLLSENQKDKKNNLIKNVLILINGFFFSEEKISYSLFLSNQEKQKNHHEYQFSLIATDLRVLSPPPLD